MAKKAPSAAEAATLVLEQQNRDIKSREKTAKDRIKQLEQLVDLQSEQLKRKLDKSFNLKPARIHTTGKEWCRIVIPDTHGHAVDQKAVSAMLADMMALQPKEVVLLGDHIDCGGFLAQHHTMCYVAETEYSYEEDIAAANATLDAIQKASAGAKTHYVCGNHERRVEKWCVTQTLRNKKDSKYLMQVFGVPVQLHLDARRITFYNENEHHMGLRTRGTIKLGKCLFTHGNSTAKHAAHAMVSKYSAPIVFGHTHRADSYTNSTEGSGVISAWNPGCLCVLQPMWRNTDPTNWSHGYGLQICRNDGSFLHINVPILDGVSYMRALTRKL